MKNLKLLLVAPLAALMLSSVAYGAQRPGPDEDGGWEDDKSDETVAIGGSMAAASEIEMASSDVWSIIDAHGARRNRFSRDKKVPLWALIQIVKQLSLQEVLERLPFFCCDGQDETNARLDLASKNRLLAERRALKITLLNAALEDRDPAEDTTPDEVLLRVKKRLKSCKAEIEESDTATHVTIDSAITRIDAIYRSPQRKDAFEAFVILVCSGHCYDVSMSNGH